MGQFILPYSVYLDSEKLNEEEGWKTWLATFMLLLNLGVVPPKIQASDTQTKIEWVQSLPKNSIELGKFAGVLTRNSKVSEDDKDEISELLATFNAENGTNLNVEQVIKYLTCDSYEKDDNTRYKWSFSPSMTSEVGTDIYKLQPAKYGAGVALISDYGDFMKPTFEDSLNKVLFAYEKLTGVEIAVLTIPSLYEADPQEYAQTIFNKWGIGKAGSNNGILILTSMGDRKWFIKTGYGMEGMFPDALCKRFGERYLVPNFKEGDYEKGYSELVEAMKKEFGSIPIQMKKDLEAKYNKIERENMISDLITLGQVILLTLVIGLIVYLVRMSIRKRRELNERIKIVKSTLIRLDSSVANLIKYGDPMFNDDEILNGLKKAVEELNKRKIKDKTISDIIQKISLYGSQLEKIKIQERKIIDIKNKINKTYNDIKSYEDKPTQMKDVAETALKIINEISFNNIDISDESISKYSSLIDRVGAYYNKYKDFDENLSNVKNEIENFDKLKNEMLKKLKYSKKMTQQVIDMGHDTSVNVKEEDIENLNKFIEEIGSVYMTDLPAANNMLKSYRTKVSSMSNLMDKPIKKFQDIMDAKKFVQEDNRKLSDLINDIKSYSRWLKTQDVDNAENCINEYKEIKRKNSNSRKDIDPYGEENWDEIPMKNIFIIADALKRTIETLEGIIEKALKRKRDYEEEERRKMEEEEEERRRKRRKEKEEEERRNSYSSSYSSGSSWSSGGGGGGFSFGGGSSGGGGAGGSF